MSKRKKALKIKSMKIKFKEAYEVDGVLLFEAYYYIEYKTKKGKFYTEVKSMNNKIE